MITQKATNLVNHFLLAMPGMADPQFENSVVLIAEHNKDGALGLVVNRPIRMDLRQLFESVDLDLNGPCATQSVLDGGPVHPDRGFVLHRQVGRWASTIAISDDLALTSSKDILEALSTGSGPTDLLVTLGCSSWGPGQLEDELVANAWLTVAVDSQIVFDTPIDQRFVRAYSLLGIDPVFLSGVAGHA